MKTGSESNVPNKAKKLNPFCDVKPVEKMYAKIK
jgi:hypothetical protein